MVEANLNFVTVMSLLNWFDRRMMGKTANDIVYQHVSRENCPEHFITTVSP